MYIRHHLSLTCFFNANINPYLLVPILSHSIKSSSCELLNVMIRYNLPPSLCSHYNRFFATTGQSAPTWYFGFEPLGCSHCAHPLALPCRFPSSVIKPEYSSCPLKDASRIANNSGSRYTYNSVCSPTTWLFTKTVHWTVS